MQNPRSATATCTKFSNFNEAIRIKEMMAKKHNSYYPHSKSLYKLRTNATVRYSHYLRKNTKHSYLRAASTLVCTDFVIDEIERIWK